jgi:signal peptidase II
LRLGGLGFFDLSRGNFVLPKVNKVDSLFPFLVVVLGVAVDQAAKFSILAFLPAVGQVHVFSFFDLILTFNFGTSFGLLSPQTDFDRFLLLSLSVFLCLVLLVIFFRSKTSYEKTALALIVSGSIGNLIDRFFHGAVVDFLDFHFKTFHWPAFNLADSFISIGCIFLIFSPCFVKRKSFLNKYDRR